MLHLLALPPLLLLDPMQEHLRPLQVSVLDSVSGEPVPEVELRWVTNDAQHFDLYHSAPECFHVLVREEFFAGGAPLARTGADGRASLAHVEHPGFLCASRGAERGCARVSALQEGELTLRLLRDWPLQVEVVDPSGAPLDGLGVCLSYTLGDGGERRDAPETRVPIVNGSARIEHAGFFQGARESGCAFHVGLTGWIGKSVRAWLPTVVPPSGPVRLTLPPHGSLRICVLDEDGRPADAVDPLWIGEPALLPADVAWPQAHPSGMFVGGQGYLVQPFEKSVVTLHHVALGSKLLARARRNEESSPSSSECTGPALPGESAQAVLHLGSGCTTIRGRIHVPVDMRLLGFALAPESRFELDLAPERVAKLNHQLGFLALANSGSRGAAWYLWFDSDWGPGVQELGEIVLEDPPLLAAGRVFDASTHAPLAGVRVRRLPAPPPDWPVPAVQTDASGYFELRDRFESSVLTIEFSLAVEGLAPRVKERKVHLGTRDLVVELAAR